MAGKGTVVVFIEKVGIVDQIKHIIDRFGIAFVNTQGHFADYPASMVLEIIKKGGYVVILTDFDCAGIHIAERIVTQTLNELGEKGRGKIVRLGVDLQMLEYFVSKGVKNVEGKLLQFDEFKSMVEESYPLAEKDDDQKPRLNVVNPIIEYAIHYTGYLENPNWKLVTEYKRYMYIYDNFQYLTGLNIADILTHDYYNNIYLKDGEAKKIVESAMKNRKIGAAKRIELDSVIKVTRANLFGEFLIDTIREKFPLQDYTRAMELVQEYFTEKFNILPKNTKSLILYTVNRADIATRHTDEQILKELKQVDVRTHGLLDINIEEVVNERLRAEAIQV